MAVICMKAVFAVCWNVFVGERKTEAFASTFDVRTGPFIFKFGFKGVR